jgi:hypothetical protein
MHVRFAHNEIGTTTSAVGITDGIVYFFDLWSLFTGTLEVLAK